ncbi:MAG: hypothetical protein DHS20C11_13370 [Lysobacteraceae bacterium]|nr:MAG: hypothetical protein DHS20C11_13370 [Xanthomonadaceae bacterium]
MVCLMGNRRPTPIHIMLSMRSPQMRWRGEKGTVRAAVMDVDADSNFGFGPTNQSIALVRA